MSNLCQNEEKKQIANLPLIFSLEMVKTIRTEKLHNRDRNMNPEKEKTEKKRRRKRERRETGDQKREIREAGRRKSRYDFKRDDSSKVRIYQNHSCFYGLVCPTVRMYVRPSDLPPLAFLPFIGH